MAVALGPVPYQHSPTSMADPTFSRAHEDYSPAQGPAASRPSFPGALVLNTPQNYSGPSQGYNVYPTPQSAAPVHQQQQAQHPYLQKHTLASTLSTPSPPLPQWQQAVAGPSTYRRTPNIASPMSINGSEHTSSRMPSEAPSPAKGGPKGRATAQGEQVMMDGMERMVVDEGDGRIGVEDPFGERSYTEVKCLGDGSFGTVWLCDWRSPVKSDVVLSAMQCGAGARPEWVGKRLVALKRMKRVWEGGWSQAKNLGEIHSLARIPQHHAIIPLYDAFISPKSRELYFVFECMEGNLYQLTKSRKGRPLAAGLIASCFHQISSGLHHIHRHGYFHRDMKPENLLVTTTGLAEYLTASAVQQINSSRNGRIPDEPARDSKGNELPRYEKDVAVIVKLADFGLARATASKPPYTEYVSTRWYRAPEVLLRSTEYGPPVDMWALGTILAEMLNLKPLFPGVSEIDQVYRITETLGDPATDYGVDERGKAIGGGVWLSGVKLAKNVGFSFPKRKPIKFRGLFSENVPQSLVDCIGDLLRYNPKLRMTSAECIDHPYFHETLPHLERTPPLPKIPFSKGQLPPVAAPKLQPDITAPPRNVPPSHSHHEVRPAFANGDMRTLPPPVGTPDAGHRINFPSSTSIDRYGPSALVSQLRELDLPTDDLHSYGHRPAGHPARSTNGALVLGPDPSGSSLNLRTQAWAEDTGRRASNAHSTVHDGSVFEGSEAAASNASFTQFNLSQHSQPSVRSQSRVANYVQAQEQISVYEDGTPRVPTHQPPAPAITRPVLPSASTLSLRTNEGASKLLPITTGKKKKWGLSSVFGGGDKSSMTNLATVEEVGYQGSSSLKRTQSGNNPISRGLEMSSSGPPPIIDDPKLAKKEAEKAKREAEKLKREAAARIQKERARAVMMKRQHMMEAQPGTILENTTSGFSGSTDTKLRSDATHQRGVYGNSGAVGASSSSVHALPSIPAGPSLTSIHSQVSDGQQSNHSIHSHQSRSHPQLPSATRPAYELPGRHKARRRNEDDDHSMSSFDHNSLRSRSVLTIGTIDSDPGPRRGRQDYPEALPHTFGKDPLLARRAPSSSSFHHLSHGHSSSKLASMSNPSLESQLARDFQAHANVAGSSSTLGQLPGASTAAFSAALGQPLTTKGSAPTSPYGHPNAAAVAHGGGMGRTTGAGMLLPSISTWEGQHEASINPMFRVPAPAGIQPHPDAAPGSTLPPFSDIARVADHHPQQR